MYFDVAHHTLYQGSTATALVEGIYEGAVRVDALREHGDLGLGTFEDLDGEMVIVDGHFFQVRGDGSVREVDDAVLSPFAVITRFAPEPASTLDQCPDMGRMTSRFDALRHSDNVLSSRRRDLRAFLASGFHLAGMVTSVAFGVFPNVLPSNTSQDFSLTFSNAAIAQHGLIVGLSWFIPGMALAIGYSVFVHRHFAGGVD